MRKNVIRGATGIMGVCGRCIYSPAQTKDPTAPWYVDPSKPNVSRVLLENNIAEDIIGRKWGYGYARVFQFSGGPASVKIRNNTFHPHDGVMLLFDNGSRPMQDFAFTDNVAGWGEQGINWSSGTWSGYDYAVPGGSIERNAWLCIPASFAQYVPRMLPAARFPGNAFFYASAGGCSYPPPQN
jgi:hypothetical protein